MSACEVTSCEVTSRRTSRLRAAAVLMPQVYTHMRIPTTRVATLTSMWDVLVGEVKVGRLTDPQEERGTTRCTFTPAAAFERYAGAFAAGNIWEADDDALDAVVDEIAVDGVFLVGDDSSQIVDPDLRIEGDDAWFSDQSSSST